VINGPGQAMHATLRLVCDVLSARESAHQKAMRKLLAPPAPGAPKLSDSEIAKLECEVASQLGAALALKRARAALEVLIPADVRNAKPD